MDLADLVSRAAHGDRAAFASLATQYIDRCYALAYRILRDRDRAQDATQQALIGAWRDLADAARPGAVRGVAPSARRPRLLRGGARHPRWNARFRIHPISNDTAPIRPTPSWTGRRSRTRSLV
jgi:hypothetical protein